MKKLILNWSLSMIVLLSGSLASAQTPVEQFGQLKVVGNKILGANNAPAQFRGMSLFWSQWQGRFYNANVVKWLRDDWCSGIIRAAMAVDNDGYATNPTAEKNKIFAVIDAAIANGIYVIVDFHVHDAVLYKNQAKTFFAEVATKYGNQPNIIYEIWNEPINVSWSNVIKPYHNELVQTIRAIDPDNIIVCGTRNWSQRVDEAANDPVTGTNIAYTLHYYAASHGQELRNYCTQALNKNVAIIVTEYGVCEASGDGAINVAESNAWWTYLDNNNISYCAWAISDKAESASALPGGASSNGGWAAGTLTASGKLERDYYKSKCGSVVVVDPPKNNYKIYRSPSAITIDGTVDAFWNNASVLPQTIGNVLQTGITNSADLSGTFKALWDNNYLYVLGDIKDNVLNQDSPNSWDDDCVELYFDINNDKAGAYGANDAEYNFEYNNAGVVTANPGVRSVANINYVMVPKTGGYTFEVRIPWSTLQGTPVVGQLLGFDLHVNDDDDGGVRDSKLAWNATADDAWQFTTSFGTAVLEDSPSLGTEVEEMMLEQVSVYPNPTNDIITVGGLTENFDYEVFDNMGRKVLSGNLTKDVYMNHLSAGVYTLVIKCNGKFKSIKVVKGNEMN
ncbi:MAG: cellulase family glycosylhydrolase [Bacteroidetes bacterium]|nr:cellulase family glycosylhydrolase [Bacteroidota bacterium]